MNEGGFMEPPATVAGKAPHDAISDLAGKRSSRNRLPRTASPTPFVVEADLQVPGFSQGEY